VSRDALEAWTAYVLETTRHVIESFGPRPPGSEGERRAQEFVRDQLLTSVDGLVQVESFPVAQKAFFALPPLTSLLLLAAVAAHWIAPWPALAASSMAVLLILFELILYRQFLDPFFPKSISTNVVGVQPPSGKVSRRLVLNAHTDAAYEWRWHHRFPRAFPLLLYYGLASLAVVVVIDVLMAILALVAPGGAEGKGVVWLALGAVQLLCVPGGLAGLGFTTFHHVSPGANDDLSGVFLVTGLAGYLRRSGTRLENTELVFLITGSEEAGLRGAKAFTRRHRGQWQDVPTIVITLDTIRDLAHLHVYEHDRNGTVRHDPAVCELLREAGRQCGLELGSASVFLGSTDATAFTLAGIRSAALCAMDPRPAHYYHNRRDNWDDMGPECIRKTSEVILEAVRQYDRAGLC
jgi:hypothetical protein